MPLQPKKKFEFRCQAKFRKYLKGKTQKCTYKVSAFKGTWFKGQVPLKENLLLIYWYLSSNVTLEWLQGELGLGEDTLINWESWIRDVCMNWVEANVRPIGGEGVRVQIDESKLGKRMYHRGRRIKGAWVFGGIDESNGDFFVCFVPNRERETLYNIIMASILPGSIIVLGM